MRILLFIAAMLLSFCLSAQIAQWRGENRDGIFNETGLLKKWPENGPQLLLKVDGIGEGWSSAVVQNEIIFVTGKTDNNEILSAINNEGKILWQTTYGQAWDKSFPSTRSTPTVENNKIYLSSGSGEVVCIDAQSGSIVWKRAVFAENEGETGTWGVAESILLVGNKVVFTTGGEKTMMVALDKNTGADVWKSKSLNDELAYVSPILIQHNGIEQIIGVSAKYIFGINPNDGTMPWNYDYCHVDDADFGDGGAAINCTSPLFRNGEIYLTSGYNHTGAMFRLNNDCSNVEFLWKDEMLDNHHGGVVQIDGKIYGSNWINNNKGNWCCIDWATAKVNYETELDNKGSIVAADGMLYIYTEKKGTLALVRPNPEKLEVISSFQINEGKGAHWAHPSIYNGKLYMRHGDVLMVYNIK